MHYTIAPLVLVLLVACSLHSDESFVKEKKKKAAVIKKNPTESIAHQYGQITKLCADMHEKLAHIEQHSIAKMYEIIEQEPNCFFAKADKSTLQKYDDILAHETTKLEDCYTELANIEGTLQHLVVSVQPVKHEHPRNAINN